MQPLNLAPQLPAPLRVFSSALAVGARLLGETGTPLPCVAACSATARQSDQLKSRLVVFSARRKLPAGWLHNLAVFYLALRHLRRVQPILPPAFIRLQADIHSPEADEEIFKLSTVIV